MLARSTLVGNARASVCGTSMEYSSHIFFCAVTSQIFNFFNAESGNEEAAESNMKLKDYQMPAMKVVVMNPCAQLLAGSGGLDSPDPFTGGEDPLNPVTP